MSNQHVNSAWELVTGSPITKLLLIALADHADASGECFPSIGRLATRTELARRTVIGGLKKLESMGFITIRRTSGSRSIYVVNLCTSCTRALNAPVQDVHQTRAPEAPVPVQDVHQTRAGRAPKPSVTLIEPSVTLTQESAFTLEGESRTKTPSITVDDIYEAYPRKIAGTSARKAIVRALKQVPADQLLIAVRKYSDAVAAARKERQFIPYPATWFNGERWNDSELPQPATGSGTPYHALALTQARQALAKLQSASIREKQASDYKAKLVQAQNRVAQLEGRTQ